ncbi:hypothetical protein RMN57_02580 [Kitasatospora sp. CM 4170]|uniref:Uncharacterized protein n=1 Tax=Kitasatospora aburaviensis TaxID=67265 RepID=A0ABW1EV96_9ACTN|nr:hypothetical protein [Kitasatospora sp. CM 4170]WNM43665.1 hypothetical protein RMN57_02580 [Kitasatospora sp. CM 4170]
MPEHPWFAIDEPDESDLHEFTATELACVDAALPPGVPAVTKRGPLAGVRYEGIQGASR